MKPETIETITRHLKGIVAALEKEKTIKDPESFNGLQADENSKGNPVKVLRYR